MSERRVAWAPMGTPMDLREVLWISMALKASYLLDLAQKKTSVDVFR